MGSPLPSLGTPHWVGHPPVPIAGMLPPHPLRISCQSTPSLHLSAYQMLPGQPSPGRRCNAGSRCSSGRLHAAHSGVGWVPLAAYGGGISICSVVLVHSFHLALVPGDHLHRPSTPVQPSTLQCHICAPSLRLRQRPAPTATMDAVQWL